MGRKVQKLPWDPLILAPDPTGHEEVEARSAGGTERLCGAEPSPLAPGETGCGQELTLPANH